MEIARFFEIHKKAQPFSLKDLQTVGVVITWFEHCGITLHELAEYVLMVPALTRLIELEYFHPNPPIGVLKRIKEIERSLPPEIRKQWRRARLEHSFTGSLSGKG
jgi:hypothetical protein